MTLKIWRIFPQILAKLVKLKVCKKKNPKKFTIFFQEKDKICEGLKKHGMKLEETLFFLANFSSYEMDDMDFNK